MREYTNNQHYHKESWGKGPWENEPDKATWVDKDTGLACMFHRNTLGALCGYVGVPNTHPVYKQHYDKVDVDVHGGLTFAGLCSHGEDESYGICHVPEPGQPDDVWWLGFDCAHLYDLSPYMNARPNLVEITNDCTYRDRAYVEDQIEKLASQLKQMEGK